MSDTQETVQTAEKQSRERLIVISVLVIVAALIGGYYLSTALIPTPKIGVLRVQSQVSGLLAEVMAREITYARENDDIKGIVMIINSPGGGAASGHDIYYQVRKLREEKPIVASMDSLAASAAYQIGVGANEIYAKPAAFVGNVGVITGLGQPETLSEQFITTGPFKTTGGSPTSFLQKLDLLHADFRDSVVAERQNAPNPLKITPEQLATGEIWVGIEAKEYGLIDEIGSVIDATDRVAEMAGLRNYEVVDIREEVLADLRESSEAKYEAMEELYAELDAQPEEFDITAAENSQWPTFYEIYIPLE